MSPTMEQKLQLMFCVQVKVNKRYFFILIHSSKQRVNVYMEQHDYIP